MTWKLIKKETEIEKIRSSCSQQQASLDCFSELRKECGTSLNYLINF